MSVDETCLSSKLAPALEGPTRLLHRSGSDLAISAIPRRSYQGRPIGSIAARAQAWERLPATGYLTIGSVRYGVRLASPKREVVPPRGALAKLPAEDDCCCGVVQLASAWPRAATPPSRIPLSPRAKNTAEEPVYRGALDVSRPPELCDGVMKGTPPTPTSFRRRFLGKLGSSSPSSQDGENSRLIPPADSREDLPSASATSTVQSTFDKLQRFRFGGGAANAGGSDEKSDRRKRSGDKTEKLRELTDLLRGRPDRKKPPTPQGKSPRPSGLRSLFGSTTSLASSGSTKEAKGGHKRAASVTSVGPSGEGRSRTPNQHAQSPVEKVPVPAFLEEETPKEEVPVPTSTQLRQVPPRSASFSQVDYNSSNGKYSCKRTDSSKDDKNVKAMTFPRKTHVDAATSASPPPERVPEERTCSTPSVDSAVGSDEGLGPVSNCSAHEVKPPSAGRSLTYPLSSKKNALLENIPFTSIDGNGLKNLHMSRDLPDVSEEISPECNLSNVERSFQSFSINGESVVNSDISNSTGKSDPGLSPVLQTHSSHDDEMLLPLENLGREIDEMLVQQYPEQSKKPEIYVTTWPKTNDPDHGSVNSDRTRKSLTLNCSLRPLEADEIKSGDKTNDSVDELDRNSVSPQRWSGGTDSSHSTRDCGSEPMSPEDLSSKPEWPKSKKLVCQSSEERDDDGKPRQKPYLGSRNDSMSDGESDQADRSPSCGRRDADRTGSPSPLFNPMFELPENGRRPNKRTTHPPRRYPKRPLRGPYGQMLEAEMKMSQKNSNLTYLEEYVPLQLASLPGSPERPASDPHLSCPRPRANTASARSMDDSHLLENYASNPKVGPKRKISANIPLTGGDGRGAGAGGSEVIHHRTTSSPSQLVSCPTPAEPPPRASQALLAQLLKGSSERGHLQNKADSLLAAENLKDERSHVVIELVETESFYVDSLQIIVKEYLTPLKNSENEDLIDAVVVDDIFFQLPEILQHHEILLEDLKKRLKCWSPYQKVGDIILDSFTKQSVIETYMSYVSNWKRAKEAFKATCKQKPLFVKFLANTARGHKGKLNLDALIIMPVQRIPHYELLIQRLLKNTEPSHPDHSLLLAAQRELHDLAVKIDMTRTECLQLEQQQRTLRDLQALIEGLTDLSVGERFFVRTDPVTMVTAQGNRKERAVFLFSDLVVITSIKRRTGPIKRPVPACSGPLASTLSIDTNKYKLLRRLSLEEVEVVKTKDEKVRSMLREVERLTEDAATLSHLGELAATLHCARSSLDEVLREMLSGVTRQLQDRQTGDAHLACLELNLTTQNEGETISLIFGTTDKRTSWEEAFSEAKQKLFLTSELRPCPEFVVPVPIRKTRAGLQFTCASPAAAAVPAMTRDVWVCNSDGYVGQVCVLSLQPEPTVVSCNGVCNARILCIASIPSALITDSGSNRESGSSSDTKEGGQASTSGEEGDDADDDVDSTSSSSSPSDDDDPPDPADPDLDMRRSKSEPLSGEVSVQVSADDSESMQPAMWLGTEDGNIHVYNCTDNIRVKKNKVKIQHGSSVQAIIYYDGRVFVALANGDVIVYSRDRNGGWNTAEPESVAVGTAAASVTKITPVAGRLWCACHNMMRILNITSLQVEKSFAVSPDCSRQVSGIAVGNLGVWIALHNSAVIRLFHAVTFDNLADVNVAPAVTKMLSGCDDIIRQHKAACLRVTSLLSSKDLLWIGTSAGVVLNMALPHVTASTTKLNNVPNVIGVPQGHTGHVRFLTCVDVTPPVTEPPRPPRHRHSLKSKPDPSPSNSSKVLVISGGDGYEDFRSVNASEIAGREDATNHLLLWQI